MRPEESTPRAEEFPPTTPTTAEFLDPPRNSYSRATPEFLDHRGIPITAPPPEFLGFADIREVPRPRAPVTASHREFGEVVGSRSLWGFESRWL